METDQLNESKKSSTAAKLELLKNYWCPFSITYDPLKAGSIDGTDTEPHDKAIIRAQNAVYRPSSKAKGRPECTIFVGRLDYRTKKSDLLEIFGQYGRIVNCRVVEDIVTGGSKGYGFVEFETERAATRAYRNAHKSWIDGREIFVDMECGRLLPGWVPRRHGGGFNGKKESGQLRFGCRDRPFKKPIGLLSSSEIQFKYDEKYTRDKPDSVRSNRS